MPVFDPRRDLLNSNNLFQYIPRSNNAVSLASKCKLRTHLSIKKVCFVCFFHVATALFVSDKDYNRLCHVIGFTRPHGSKMFADSKISTLESGFKKLRIRIRIRRIRVDERRIQKENVVDSKLSGYVWTGPKKTKQNRAFFVFLSDSSGHLLDMYHHPTLYFLTPPDMSGHL